MKNYWLNRKNRKRWKRLEIMSGGCSLIMKDDALDNCGAWGPEKGIDCDNEDLSSTYWNSEGQYKIREKT